MTSGDAVIDISADPLARRRNRRRWLLRVGVPILSVVLIIAVILAIAVYANEANRRGALALSDDVLVTLEGRIAAQVAVYFQPAARAVEIARDLVAFEPSDQRQALFEKFAIAELRETSQIAQLLLADQLGDFTMVRRNEQTGGIDTKRVSNAWGQRKVLWIRRDLAGQEVARDEDPGDAYDPRTRPWFKGARSADSIFWTEVYHFYTGGMPGITASVAGEAEDKTTSVLGADIAIANLARFLAGLAIGQSGHAMIVDGNGQLIAYPDVKRILRDDPNGPRTARIDEIGDNAAAAAYDRFRVEGPGRRTVTVGRHRYLTAVTPLKAAGHGWAILIVVPEKDFVGFVARNNRTGLVMSLAIVAIAALGAAMLVQSGLRADRATRLAHDRSRAAARQSELFHQVANDPDLFDPSPDRAPLSLTETAIDVTGARRASLWYLTSGDNALRCADSFQREGSVHAAGLEVRRSELPHFFAHLASGREIEVADAAGDPRTTELHRLMLAPLGNRALSLFPIRRRDRVVGALWVEDPLAHVESRAFMRILAGMAALRAGEQSHEIEQSAQTNPGAEADEPARVRSRSPDLLGQAPGTRPFTENVYPEVGVLFIRVDDVAVASAAQSTELVDAIACAIQEVAAEQDLPYLKIVGSDIVGAAGFTADGPLATARVANTAIAVRERIHALCGAEAHTLDFRFGIDCGVVRGHEIGTEPRLFNLWGVAVETAKTMASSAFPGTIQTSEAAYLQLRQHFLFRQRGTFHLPTVGTSQTFILAGRL